VTEQARIGLTFEIAGPITASPPGTNSAIRSAYNWEFHLVAFRIHFGERLPRHSDLTVTQFFFFTPRPDEMSSVKV
jgi:hypothetical protein